MLRTGFLLITMALLSLMGTSIHAQLDTIHYMPPYHAAAEFGSHFLYLTTPSRNDITVEITLGNGASLVDAYGNDLDSVVISNAVPQRIDLGTSLAAGADVPILVSKSELNTPIGQKGLILRSDDAFYVNYRVLSGLQAASLTSKGGNALGRDFRIGHIPGTPLVNNPVTFQRSNFVSVMATEDNTEIVISEIDPGLSYEDETGFSSSGGEVRDTLDRGESYVLSAYYGTNWPAANAMGLMGGRVTSDHPIAVSCGSWVGSPFAFNNQDIGIDQIVPIEYTGEGYALVRGDGPAALETPIAIAYHDSTFISINDLGIIDSLDKGEYLIIDDSYYTADENMYVHSDKPFYMYQSLAGANDNRTGGLNFIPPLGCSSEKSIDNIMDIDLINNTLFQGKLFIVAESGSNVWINDNILPAPFLRPVPGNPDYVTIKSPNLSGLIDVRSDGAIQVGVFGRNNAAGWAGYFSGFKRAVSPGVVIDADLACDGLLSVETDENTQRIEWYRNGVLIDTTSTVITDAEPGEYFIVGYNEFCRAIEVDTSATIVIRPPMSYDVTSDTVPCGTSRTGNIDVIVNSGGYPPYEFQLEGVTPFSSRSSWDSLAAGTYQVVIRDSIGCIYRDTVVIEDENMFPMVDPDLPDTLTCDRTDVQLSAEGSSRGSEYEYRWSTTAGNILSNDTTAIVNRPGVYVLEITNIITGCQSLDSVLVSQDTAHPVINVSPDDTLNCRTDMIDLHVEHDLAVKKAVINWSGPSGGSIGDSTSIKISVDRPGRYSVTVRDRGNGCASSEVINVMIDTMKPVPRIDPPDTLTCTVTRLRLNAEYEHHREAGIVWRTDTGRILSGSSTLNPVIDLPGEYRIILNDTISGCSDSIEVVVYQDVEEPEVDLGPDLRLTCTDTLFNVIPMLGKCSSCISIWQSISGQMLNLSSDTQEITTAGVYELTRINTKNGCRTSDTLQVDQAPEPYNIVLDIENGRCDEQWGSIQVDSVYGGEGPYQYSVDGGQTFSNDELFDNLPPGTYEIRIRDRNGCELSYRDLITIPRKIRIISVEDLTLDLGEEGEFRVKVNLTRSEIANIIWTPDEELSCSNCLTPRITAIQNGVYHVFVEDIYGCTDEATLYLNVKRNLNVFIPNVFTPNGDNLNDGFTGFVQKGQAKGIRSMRIYSRWGELIFETGDIPVNEPSLGWKGNFNGEKALPGVYAYIIEILFIDDTTELYFGDVTLMR